MFLKCQQISELLWQDDYSPVTASSDIQLLKRSHEHWLQVEKQGKNCYYNLEESWYLVWRLSYCQDKKYILSIYKQEMDWWVEGVKFENVMFNLTEERLSISNGTWGSIHWDVVGKGELWDQNNSSVCKGLWWKELAQ